MKFARIRGIQEGESAREQGAALAMVIIIAVIGIVLAIGMGMAAMSALDRSRDTSEKLAASGPAGEGINAYREALSAGIVGEHNNFMFTEDLLRQYARENGGNDVTVLPNTSLTTSFASVDQALPGNARFTVRRRSAGGAGFAGEYQYRFWQVLSVVQPRYGVSSGNRVVAPGGAVLVVVRGWSGNADGSLGRGARPTILRAMIRPPRFSDYQLVADGKISLGEGAVINGKVHSNGFNSSFLDQFQSTTQFPGAITASNIRCERGARISTSAKRPGADDGSIGGIRLTGSPTCLDRYQFDRQGEQVNMLRAQTMVSDARSKCGQQPPEFTIRVVCFPESATATPDANGIYQVELRDKRAVIAGCCEVDVSNTAADIYQPQSGQARQFGTVLVFNGSVAIRGNIGGGSRLTIVASDPSGNQGFSPSIWIVQAGAGGSPVGGSADATSAFGAVADGDVIAMESTACPLLLRGAFIARSGMLSMDPRNRNSLATGPLCSRSNPAFALQGSISGHFPPYMRVGTRVGYGTRSYRYDPYLYDNAPPLFPTTGPWDWQSSSIAEMSLDCYREASDSAGTRSLILADTPGCGQP